MKVFSITTVEGFNEFYNAKYKSMVSLARRHVDSHSVAEEVVQEAFNMVWQNRETLQSPASYMRTVVTNRCHDILRKRKTRRNYMRYVTQSVAPERQYMLDALAKVAPRRRKALYLRFYGDRTINEIATAMDIPTGTAKSLLHRGILDLRVSVS